MTIHPLLILVTGFASAFATMAVAANPVLIASGEGLQSPRQPQAAITADGSVHLVFGVGDEVFHCRSLDGGESFDQPKMAFRADNLSLGMRRGPRIAETKDALTVTVIGGKLGKGRDGDLVAWRSTDRGATWSGPARVNDSADSAREGLHAMASSPEGSVWCAWLDLREKRTEVYAAQSIDGGATWSRNILVYRSPDGNVCECCHPTIVAGDDAVHVMFRNSLAGNRDMYVTTSKDDGKTFLPAKKLGEGSWKLDGCPMDGGMMAVGPKDSLISVWRRDGEVFSIASHDSRERSLGKGEQPWIARSTTGPVIVWTAGRIGELFVKSPAAEQPQLLAEAACDPVVTAAANGDRAVIACWESKRGGQSMVWASSIETGQPRIR